MEGKVEEKKHDKLIEADPTTQEEETTEIVQGKQIKQLLNSPFINDAKSWDDEELKIPEDVRLNIINQLGFHKPSKIQSIAI